MALSTKKKNQISADHKAGRFETQTALLKHYKIDRKTLVKILEGISGDNTDIVEAGVAYEKAKNSLKNPVEIKAIENVVEERTKHLEFFQKATLKNASVMIKKIDDDNVSFNDHKLVQETLDKGLISMGLADRHAPKSDVNVNQQQAQEQKTIKVTYE